MEKQIKTPDKTVPYALRVSRRARHMRISVSADAGVVVTVPFGMGENVFGKFIVEKSRWIFEKLRQVAGYKDFPRLKRSKKEYSALRPQALALAKERVHYWNSFYNFPYSKVVIKNQKTRWGSCSQKGNLNFNYKIVHLTPELLDYLVVHEVCHLKEMNHSANFWNLVSKTVPNYKNLKKQLKKIIIL